MIDQGDAKIAIYAPPESPIIQGDASLRPDLVAIKLQNSRSDYDLKIFRMLININIRLDDTESSATWNLVIVELLRIITDSDNVGQEQVLMASLALVNVSFRNHQLEDFFRYLGTYWDLEDTFLRAFGECFPIRDLEWFKLAVTHGYLQMNIETIYVPEIISLPFEVLQRNCLRYTKYFYFAYKTLQTWLDKASKTDLWWTNDATRYENNLEAIIFSNWDSCICEIARRNSTQLFSTYLRIMIEKYDGFLNHIFENCMQHLSWQNEKKYTILAEVCKIWDDLPKIVSSDLPSCLFTSLTKNHLKHPGTKLYLTILDKLKANEWEEIFSKSFFRVSAIWESKEQATAIELLWEQWMKPTIEKFAEIFEFLWKHDSMKRLKLSRSYLERIGDRKGFQLIYEDNEFREILHSRVIDISEHVRLNAFAILCQLKNWKIAVNEADPFAVMKRFLYFNVNTSSISIRKGIVKNFDVLFANIARLADKDPDVERHICDFLHWLHNFFLDCFELGASYQRKILAMSLYEIVLILTSFDDCPMGIWNVNKSKGERRKLFICASNLRRKINSTDKWLYCDERSARIMLSLVCDQVAEVRDKATFMILQYFCNFVFTSQMDNLDYWQNTSRYYNSSKFYEVAIGVAIEKVKILWNKPCEPPSSFNPDSTIRKHINHARNQLSKMQHGSQDILNCLSNHSPVYGSMTIILEVGFLNESVNKIYNESTIREILDLTEAITTFFLSTLSVNSKCDKYSSSFEEMGRAIKDSIRNSNIDVDDEQCILSTADQLILSCIWMSLKVSSEIAAEIGLIANTEEFARRSIDLIVSILLKCRHKGAIEAAGLALAKLTKSMSEGKYNVWIESHLIDLLNIDNSDNINLTRRGAGLSIMFHRIVSSDGRTNRPWLHFAVRKLLDSLRINTKDASIQSEDCLIDSQQARHLHFLRTLVADKALQAQLVPYIENICLTCFKYLESSEWTVRNASLQLFGAVVPRLVGQCNARELDYGIGNSIDHFVTHYPILAATVMMELKFFVDLFHRRENPIIKSNIVPMLTLLSKMSSGGCELVDYSSNDYLSQGRKVFSILFGHHIFNVRVLAGKAYAAFIPLSEIPYELAKLQLDSLSVKRTKTSNYEHGQLCAQLYLVQKLKHQLQSTSETFVIRKHKNCEDFVTRGSYLQLQLLGRTVYRWLRYEEKFCYTVKSTLIRCLLESPISFSSKDLPPDWFYPNGVIRDKLDENSKPGFTEFLDNLMSFSAQLKVVEYTSEPSGLFHVALHCPEHRAITIKNLRAEDCNLQFFVDEALVIFDDRTKSNSLLGIVGSIRDIFYNDDTFKELPSELKIKIRKLTYALTLYDKSSRPHARALNCIGFSIVLKMYRFPEMERAMYYIRRGIMDEDAAVKELSIDCLSRLIYCLRGFSLKRMMRFTMVETGILIEVIITLLMDEDPEVRESMSKTLQPLIDGHINSSGEAICAKASLHKIFNMFSLRLMEDLSQYRRELTLDFVLKLFLRLVDRVQTYVSTENLNGPFQQDNTFNRDDTFFLNIVFYCVKIIVTQTWPRGSIESIEIQEIDGAINAKYEIQRETMTDLTNLVSLKIGTSQYLFTKKVFLLRMIDKCRWENLSSSRYRLANLDVYYK